MVYSDGVRTSILDQAVRVYVQRGLQDLTLGSITADIDVNYETINAYFRSRPALIEAMLLRVSAPMSEERRSLLHRIRATHGKSLQPTHVIACLVLPILRKLLVNDSPLEMALLVRLARDPDPYVVALMGKHFKAECEEFEDAFADSAPDLVRAEILWRSALFCNASAGTVVNHSLLVMCQSALAERKGTHRTALRGFASIAESLLLGQTEDAQITLLVDDTLRMLERTPTVYEMERLLSARH
jgi:AcrR family transcriptional regulator